MQLNGLGLNLIRVCSSLLRWPSSFVNSSQLPFFLSSITPTQLIRVSHYSMDSIVTMAFSSTSWLVMSFWEQWCSMYFSKWYLKHSSTLWDTYDQDTTQKAQMDQDRHQSRGTCLFMVGWHLRDIGDMHWWWTLFSFQWCLDLAFLCCFLLEHSQSSYTMSNKSWWFIEATR